MAKLEELKADRDAAVAYKAARDASWDAYDAAYAANDAAARDVAYAAYDAAYAAYQAELEKETN